MKKAMTINLIASTVLMSWMFSPLSKSDDAISTIVVRGSVAMLDWTTLQQGQIVEFTLPGGWWHEGAFELSELPLMRSGDASYVAYVAKVDIAEGIWLSVSMTSGQPVEFGHVLTIPAALATSVSFDLQQPAP